MREYIYIVEGSALLEHAVLNTGAVNTFGEKMAERVNSAEAKAWLTKKLRVYILNTEEELDEVQPTELPHDAPQWVLDAANKGEKLYRFSGRAEFLNRVQHILHFFQSVEEAASTKPDVRNQTALNAHNQAKRILTKLSRMTLEQVEQAAEEWAKLSSAALAVNKKEGVEVIMTWPDGFYAVRYTNLDVMKRDGQDLQNCLRQGMYWDRVQSGTMTIYGIRRPNDEAIVGIAIANGSYNRIKECKGKSNQPVSAAYHQYVIDFLTHIQVFEDAPDLKNCGIEYNNGKYGTFQDIATHERRENAEIWYTESKVLMRNAGRWVSFEKPRYHFGGKWAISGLDDCPPKVIISTLNIAKEFVPEEAIKSSASNFVKNGVFLRNGEWGTAAELGDQLGTFMGDTIHRVEQYLVLGSGNGGSLVLSTNGEILTSYSGIVERYGADKLGTFFNYLEQVGIKTHDPHAAEFAMSRGWLLLEDGYEFIKDIGEVVAYVNLHTDRWNAHHPEEVVETQPSERNWPIWRYNDTWMIEKWDDFYTGVKLKSGTIHIMNGHHGTLNDQLIADVIRYLVNKHSEIRNVRHKDPANTFGIPKIGRKIIRTAEDAVEAFSSIGDNAAYGPQSKLNDLKWREFITSERFEDMTPATASKLIDVLTPKNKHKLKVTGEYSLYNKKLQNVLITLPDNLFLFNRAGVFTGAAGVKAQRILDAIEKAAIALVKKGRGKYIFDLDGSTVYWHKLNIQINQTNAQTKSVYTKMADKVLTKEKLHGTEAAYEALNVKDIF